VIRSPLRSVPSLFRHNAKDLRNCWQALEHEIAAQARFRGLAAGQRDAGVRTRPTGQRWNCTSQPRATLVSPRCVGSAHDRPMCSDHQPRDGQGGQRPPRYPYWHGIPRAGSAGREEQDAVPSASKERESSPASAQHGATHRLLRRPRPEQLEPSFNVVVTDDFPVKFYVLSFLGTSSGGTELLRMLASCPRVESIAFT
jgi:hypothetical protein